MPVAVTRCLIAIILVSCMHQHAPAPANTTDSVAPEASPPPANRPAEAGNDSSAPVEFSSRGNFAIMPADAPPLRAILVDDAKVAHRRQWSDLPFHAAGAAEGQTVADIGCGTGRISLQLAAAVGETGRVLCRDISAGRIAELMEAAAATGVSNVDIAMSTKGDVMLPNGRVDVALLADVYQFVINQHESKDAFLSSLHAGVKPGGVIVVIYARSAHLLDTDRREEVNRRTLDDFIAHGLMPGRRWSFEEERFPAQILEFKKPE